MLTRRGARLATAMLLAALGLTSCGPDVVEAGPAAPPGDHLVDVVAATEAPTTTEVGGAFFAEGDCLTWNQGAADASFQVVDCTEAHLVEVTASLDLSLDYPEGAAVPASTELAKVAELQCGPVAEAFLGRALDAEDPGVIAPSTTAWDAGDREAWCTIGLARVDGERPQYVGSLRDR
jgi:hypothetical protein